MAIKDEGRFNRILVPVKKVTFQKGFFHQSSTSALKYFTDKNISNTEGYRINISPEGINVYSKTDAGTFYALQTLQELKAIYGTKIPACIIKDEPDFKRRGVYLDCSRGKVPKLQTLKELAAWLSRWKINEIQLYIENVFTFKKHPGIGKGYNPFTPDEILTFQEHCKKHHIRLVGSLASFGHLEKILSLPKYKHLGEKPGFRGYPGGMTLCPNDPGSIKLIAELYDEFMPLFEAEDFNVCCDETWEIGRGRSSKKAERIGFGRLYLDFLLKIHRLCEKHGKRMNAWADIVLKYPELLGKLPRDVVMLNWEYEANGANIARTKELADSRLPFMVCPGTSSWLTHGTRLFNSMENITKFAAAGRRYHAEGLLNTDWGDEGHRNFLGVSLHGLAHGAAHSWNGRAVDNDRFTENFCNQVFGQQNNRMAEAIKLLGSTYITCGKLLPNKSTLFLSAFEPLLPKEICEDSPINMMTDAGLKKVQSQLSEDIWPDKTKSMNNFERLAIEEYKLASRMDCLAVRRALTAKLLRAGKRVKSSELRKLRYEMKDVERKFKELWLSRNKPSRLQNNLHFFENAMKELSQLAVKGKT